MTSELIIKEFQKKNDPFDLSSDAPILSYLHPKMISNRLKHEVTSPAFSSVEEAKKFLPNLKVIKGLPYAVFQAKNENCLIDFSPYGAIAISTDIAGTPGEHQGLLPPLLEYALSAELWGPQGKWTRFHERLDKVLKEKKLLNEPSLPGRYPLKRSAAEKLVSNGIRGTNIGESYVLTMSWTFPLSALEHLIKIIQEEL